MKIEELIRRLKVQCQDNLDMEFEILLGDFIDGEELIIQDIYYEGNGPLVIIEVK